MVSAAANDYWVLAHALQLGSLNMATPLAMGGHRREVVEPDEELFLKAGEEIGVRELRGSPSPTTDFVARVPTLEVDRLPVFLFRGGLLLNPFPNEIQVSGLVNVMQRPADGFGGPVLYGLSGLVVENADPSPLVLPEPAPEELATSLADHSAGPLSEFRADECAPG